MLTTLLLDVAGGSYESLRVVAPVDRSSRDKPGPVQIFSDTAGWALEV